MASKEATPEFTKIQQLRAALQGSFIERANVINGVLSALIAGEHVLLLGPPGTAKSALASCLCKSIDGASYFERLLTKFSTPEELFGPISLAGLERDKFQRVIGGKLPEAHIAFVDEIFKANSSILNSLLTIINERAFDNDSQRLKVPLMTMFGASNELPEGAELEALFDRFLFRYWIPYVADRNNLAIMLKAPDPKTEATISLDEIRLCQQAAAKIPIDDACLGVLLDVKERVERAGVRASDRRWKRALRAMQAFAYLQGDTAVNEDHFEILPDLLWREPKERAALVQEVGKVANPIVAKISEIMDAATECVRNLPADTVGRAKFLAEAAEAIATLDQMSNEISRIKAEHPAKAKRLDVAMAQLNEMRDKTQRRAAAAAGIRL